MLLDATEYKSQPELFNGILACVLLQYNIIWFVSFKNCPRSQQLLLPLKIQCHSYLVIPLNTVHRKDIFTSSIRDHQLQGYNPSLRSLQMTKQPGQRCRCRCLVTKMGSVGIFTHTGAHRLSTFNFSTQKKDSSNAIK